VEVNLSEVPTGTLRAIAWRPVDGDIMTEVTHCEVLPGRGITTENRKPGKREITLISKERWQQACAELGVPVPWYARRANLLIEGLNLASAIGQTIVIGDKVRIRIHGETAPCGIMDATSRLKKTLIPDFRGGVHGRSRGRCAPRRRARNDRP
jgi:MOSC domain-containing protein YiiM